MVSRNLQRNLHRGLPKLIINPILRYDNSNINKSLIFKDNINKAFIYRWVNKLNGKDYLGSTANAKSRLNTYYDLKTLRTVNMPIYKAILKYGHDNFIFEIIEYCTHLRREDIIMREQYYLDNYDFDYNVLANAKSSAGYKHTVETLAKFYGRKNLLNYKHLPEAKDKLKKINLGKIHSEDSKENMKYKWAERKLKSSKAGGINLNNNTPTVSNKPFCRYVIGGKAVVVTNFETNLSTEYRSISEAASVLNLTRNTLRKYIDNKKIFIKLRL